MPLRYPNGVTTAKKGDGLGEFILPDPSTAHFYREDFDYFDPDQWTFDDATEGVISRTLLDADGGQLNITVQAAESSTQFLNGNSFSFTTGKRLWYECKLRVDLNTSNFNFGIADPSRNNGIVFTRAQITSDNLIIDITNTGQSVFVDSFTDQAPINTDLKYSFFYDGQNRIDLFIDGSFVSMVDVTNILPSVLLSPFIFFGVSAGTGTLAVDYVFVAKER